MKKVCVLCNILNFIFSIPLYFHWKIILRNLVTLMLFPFLIIIVISKAIAFCFQKILEKLTLEKFDRDIVNVKHDYFEYIKNTKLRNRLLEKINGR